MPKERLRESDVPALQRVGEGSGGRLVPKLREELRTSQGTVQRVAKQLGCGVESVRTWVPVRDVADGLAGPDAHRMAELESWNRQLEQELREPRRAHETSHRSGFQAAVRPGSREGVVLCVGLTSLEAVVETAEEPVVEIALSGDAGRRRTG